MSKQAGRKGGQFYILAMAALLLLQMGLLFSYGNKKAGFHEDELYTYYSSNKTAGLFVNDRQWLEREELYNDFVVLPGEGFRYDVVCIRHCIILYSTRYVLSSRVFLTNGWG